MLRVQEQEYIVLDKSFLSLNEADAEYKEDSDSVLPFPVTA